MPVKTYIKKPVSVQAIQYNGHDDKENIAEIKRFVGAGLFTLIYPSDDWGKDITASVYDYLHDTWVGVKDGQYIIQGIQGEFYPHDEDLFPEAYDEKVA